MAEREPSFTITTAGDTAGSNTTDTCQPWGGVTWTPSNYVYTFPYYGVDKTRQAFLIIKHLEKKKLIKLSSVKKFMELVDEIYKVL